MQDSQWERTVDIIAVEHMQRVERLQRITAARELKAELERVGQKISAAEQLKQALGHDEDAALEMEGQPGLPMEGQLAQESKLPVDLISDDGLAWDDPDGALRKMWMMEMGKENAAAELKAALENAESWIGEQQHARRPVTMAMRRRTVAVSAESMDLETTEEASALALVVQIAGQSVIAGFDTWAETSVIRRSMLTKDVKVTKVEAQIFTGVGGTKQMDELAEVPVQMRYGASVVHVMARVMDVNWSCWT